MQLNLFTPIQDHFVDVNKKVEVQELKEYLGFSCIKCGVKKPGLKTNTDAYYYCEDCAEKPLYDDYTDWHIEKGAAIKCNGEKIVQLRQFKPFCLVCQTTKEVRFIEQEKANFCKKCEEVYCVNL
jgi:hypothetical protein